jgi:hypothetical protein
MRGLTAIRDENGPRLSGFLGFAGVLIELAT